MTLGECITRTTIWAAMLGYAVGAALILTGKGRLQRAAWARNAWIFGCVAFAAHVAAAFNYYHHWEHGDAIRTTAIRTEELTGFRWGWGLYLNYVLGIVWGADVIWLSFWPTSYLHRPLWMNRAWHGFFLFMLINGAIVFGRGAVRWFGAGILLVLGSIYVYCRTGSRVLRDG